jgi:hypothetical protein
MAEDRLSSHGQVVFDRKLCGVRQPEVMSATVAAGIMPAASKASSSPRCNATASNTLIQANDRNEKLGAVLDLPGEASPFSPLPKYSTSRRVDHDHTGHLLSFHVRIDPFQEAIRRFHLRHDDQPDAVFIGDEGNLLPWFEVVLLADLARDDDLVLRGNCGGLYFLTFLDRLNNVIRSNYTISTFLPKMFFISI